MTEITKGMGLKFHDIPEKCRGEFALKVYRKGQLVKNVADHNLVVNSGRTRLAQLAAGKSGAHIAYIGVGSGSEKEKGIDTGLTEQQLFAITNASVTGMDARFDFTIGETQANGLSIREFGLFCTDKTLFSHRVRIYVNEETHEEKVLTIDKDSDIKIVGYWVLHF